MTDEQPEGATPNIIRAACGARFYKGLDTLANIAADTDAKAADRVRALDTLGRFGLGAADQASVHIHAGDGATVIGVVRLPALGETVQEGQEVYVENGQTVGAADPSGAADPRPTRLRLESGDGAPVDA